MVFLKLVSGKRGDCIMDLKCPKCGKVLSSKEEMVEHTKVHAKDAMDSMKSGLKL